ADAGDAATCPLQDQRGAFRPQGLNCDIGAYETRIFAPRPLVAGDRTAPHLVFITQPAGALEGQTFAQAPEVAVRDATGNPAGYTGSIALTLLNNGGVAGATLSGTTVRTLDGRGVARFDDLSISPAGTGYQLRAEATGLISV